MDYKKAFEILEIDSNYNDITIELIKKKYHKLALQNHPDKNGNTPESNEKFRQINEAYNSSAITSDKLYCEYHCLKTCDLITF